MNKIKTKLVGYVKVNEDVAALYLFGSQAGGLTHKESDVDTAFLFQAGKIPGSDQRLQIQDDLTALLGREVDVVVLNNASPVIRMQVLRKGKKIFERNRKAVNEFFVRTINEYDDLKRVRSVIEKNIIRGKIYG